MMVESTALMLTFITTTLNCITPTVIKFCDRLFEHPYRILSPVIGRITMNTHLSVRSNHRQISHSFFYCLSNLLLLLALPASAAYVPMTGVSQVKGGGHHTCALTTVGGVKCWGYNNNGHLGDGTTIQRLTPVNVSGLASGVTAITVGADHSCALTSGGGVKCWGYNGNGQLGDTTTTQRLIPVDVSGLTSGVTAIAANWLHTCALLTSGGVKCWGKNDRSQLGDGSVTDSSTPVSVNSLGSITAISVGLGHSCALTSGGGVKCWGANTYGQLGDTTTTQRLTPVDVSGLTSGVTAIAGGLEHTCALLTSGGVMCWGRNDNGQLGDTTTISNSTPVSVSGLSGVVTAIATGGNHTCALMSGGGMQCWGANTYGQLGNGTITGSSTPVSVGLTGITMIAVGTNHTCALISGGVKCWGASTLS